MVQVMEGIGNGGYIHLEAFLRREDGVWKIYRVRDVTCLRRGYRNSMMKITFDQPLPTTWYSPGNSRYNPRYYLNLLDHEHDKTHITRADAESWISQQ